MSDLGDTLRGARHQMRATLEEASAATHIKVSFLAAIEDGEYTALPGPAYVTGFLRNYARFLGLHPDDVVQEYYATRPIQHPTVKAATRVLANGHHRRNRSRLLWTLASIVVLLAGAYAIKQYNDASAHSSYTPAVNVTASLAGTVSPTPQSKKGVHHPITVRLRAIVPTWVRVTVDGHRVFQGILRVGKANARWIGHRSVYVMTFDGAHVRAIYDGRAVGLLAHRPGVLVDLATAAGWRQVS